MPRIAESDTEIARCFEVMAELRPHLQAPEFVGLVREMQAQGYRLAYLEHEGRIVAVAGYRIIRNLHMGRHLYLNDLVVAGDCRSRGHGTRLLHWLRGEAGRNHCAYLALDSGTQRTGAHRFYLCNGLEIAGFLFNQKTGEPADS